MQIGNPPKRRHSSRSIIASLMWLLFASSLVAGDRYAFLVAVREYDKNELTNLQFTENDITKLAETLRAAGYESQNVVLMTQSVGAQMTRYLPVAENIREELSLIVRELKADDSIVVAFAGHGVQFKNEKNAYFCPANARLADRETLISLEDVYKTLDSCAARTKVLFVDACRNDPQSNRSRSAREVELEAAGRRVAPVPPGGIAALFSCSATEQSYEDPDLKHGVFFHYVIDGLTGKGDLDKDGDVSLAELEQHVTKSVQRYVRVELRKAQTPERRGEARGLISLAKVDAGTSPKPSPTGAPKSGAMIENSIGMKLILVPPSTFEMGAPPDDEDSNPDETLHHVMISKPLLVGVFEVTQAEYEMVTGQNPSYFSPAGKGAQLVTGIDYHRLPVDSVSWLDAVEFCRQLSKRDAEIKSGRAYRLPTESEWEYFCRAGTTTPFWYGPQPATANFSGIARRTRPVGADKPNKFGLFDTHGNVWEWCQDFYGKYPAGSVTDPAGPNAGTDRVLRGGSWQDPPDSCRSAFREHLEPTKRSNSDGFRVVCEFKP